MQSRARSLGLRARREGLSYAGSGACVSGRDGSSVRSGARQQEPCGLGVDRLGEQMALDEAGSERKQLCELFLRLDTFGHGLHTEPLRECDDGAYHLAAI